MRLFEIAVRPERLYHWTPFSHFVGILEDDTLKASRNEFSDHSGVSFTRSPFSTFMTDYNIVMVFDGAALRRDFRPVPRYGDSPKSAATASANPDEYTSFEPRREAEEFVNRDVSPISKYLTHVVMPTYVLETMAQLVIGRKILAFEKGDFVYKWLAAHRVKVLQVENMKSPAWVHHLNNAIDLSEIDPNILIPKPKNDIKSLW